MSDRLLVLVRHGQSESNALGAKYGEPVLCGRTDSDLTAKGVKHTTIETPGAHTWMVWRRYLNEFAPKLFR